jgi:hypothetical protein
MENIKSLFRQDVEIKAGKLTDSEWRTVVYTAVPANIQELNEEDRSA